MKILCVADHQDPLVYSNSIKTRFKDVDLVLGAGDLPLEYYGFIVSSLNKPLYFVFGNHNLKRWNKIRGKSTPATGELWEDLKLKDNFGATFMDDRARKVENILLAGLGGSMRYNDGENQYTDFQMFLRVLCLLPRLLWNKLIHGRFLDILLTHAPPRDIHDKPDRCHTGFKIFRWFMRAFKPKYLIHGHIHLYELGEVRRTMYEQTEVVNCYDHILIDFEVNPKK